MTTNMQVTYKDFRPYRGLEPQDFTRIHDQDLGLLLAALKPFAELAVVCDKLGLHESEMEIWAASGYDPLTIGDLQRARMAADRGLQHVGT